MDEQYKAFQVNIAGQIITVETAKMVAFMDLIEMAWNWLRRTIWTK